MIFKHEIEEVDQKYEDGEFLSLADVRKYEGVFTGKTVKCSKDWGHFANFKKGDKVLVFNLDDFLKFNNGIKFILERNKSDKSSK